MGIQELDITSIIKIMTKKTKKQNKNKANEDLFVVALKRTVCNGYKELFVREASNCFFYKFMKFYTTAEGEF